MEPRVRLEVFGALAPAAVSRSTSAPTLLMPIESAIAQVHIDQHVHTIDRARLVLAASGVGVRIEPAAASVSVAALSFSAAVMEEMVQTHADVGVDAEHLQAWFSTSSVLPRTVWVHELTHRYVFERNALSKHESVAARFLEIELLKEVYFLFRDREAGADRASIQQAHSKAVASVIAYVHDHLTGWSSVKRLAKLAGTSERSLLRAFRKEVGTTPAAYWRARKLDAALDLLRGGAHTVAEIAEQVGYDNPSAFGDAFRRRFGRSPSAFKPSGPIRSAP